MTINPRRSSLWFVMAALFCLMSFPSSGQSQPDLAKRRVVEHIAPAYPTLARSMGLSGTVRVEALVSPDGRVKAVDVKGGHPVLAQAAVNTVRKWRWEPASHESREPVELKFEPAQ